MAEILEKILRTKADEVMRAQLSISRASLDKRIDAVGEPRGFIAAIEQNLAKNCFALIAEVKKGSPSKGIIRKGFDPAAIAKAYEAGGATCLSVLTDGPYFMGSEDALMQARAHCALPVLRKDFIIHPYQLYEARAWGADCILLIMAALDNDQAKELFNTAKELSLDVLVEVHSREELERAGTLGAKLIGVNNRCLKSFDTDLQTSIDLAPHMPKDAILVSESGIFHHDHMEQLAQHGYHCFLVGESLMRQEDIVKATQDLLQDKSPNKVT